MAMTFQHLLADYVRQFNYSEKFAFFLAHCVIFFLPTFVMRRFSIVFSLLSVNLVIMLFLVEPHAFTRLYASNLLLMIVVILKAPNASPVWALIGFILIASAMCLDYFYFKGQKYGESHQLPPAEFLHIGIRHILVPIAIAGFLYWWLPPLFRHVSRHRGIRIDGAATRPTLSPPDIGDILFRAIIVAVLLMITIALLNWLQKKLKMRRAALIVPMRGILRKLKKFVQEKVLQPVRPHLTNPRERIIFYYNRFCDELGRRGFARASYQTPSEYAKILRPPAADKWGIIEKITHTFEDVMYGAKSVSEDDALGFKKEVEYISVGFSSRSKSPE